MKIWQAKYGCFVSVQEEMNMAKARECLVYVKPRWGAWEPARYCESIAEAKAYAKARGLTNTHGQARGVA